MDLKVGLSGPCGSGKTTMMKALEDSEYVKSLSTPEEPIVFLPEIVRTLKKEFGFKINEHGTLETEMMVMTTHLQNLIARPRFVSDRCLVDNYIYSTLNEIPPPTWYSIWNGKLVEEMLGRYSVVFYIPNEFIPPEDGTRNLEPSYWIRSQMRFEAEYEKLTKLWPDLVVRISGPIPERIKKMEDAIRRSCK